MSKVAFLADAMLGNIARKLRVFGFDTAYLADTHDDEILRVGIEEKRTILTADRELFKRMVKANAPGVLVDCRSEVEDIAHILSKVGVRTICVGGFDAADCRPRCSACNGVLEPKSPSDIGDGVPEQVRHRQKEFFQCIECSKVYWEGGHFKRLEELAKKVNAALARQEA